MTDPANRKFGSEELQRQRISRDGNWSIAACVRRVVINEYRHAA
jgi:hypothetical protein